MCWQVWVVGGMRVRLAERFGSSVRMGEVAQRPERDRVFAVLRVGPVELHDEDDIRRRRADEDRAALVHDAAVVVARPNGQNAAAASFSQLPCPVAGTVAWT